MASASITVRPAAGASLSAISRGAIWVGARCAIAGVAISAKISRTILSKGIDVFIRSQERYRDRPADWRQEIFVKAFTRIAATAALFAGAATGALAQEKPAQQPRLIVAISVD